MVQLQKKAKGERPRYFDEPAVEKLMSITLALAGEVAVLRDRVDTIEQLSAEGARSPPRRSICTFPTRIPRAPRCLA